MIRHERGNSTSAELTERFKDAEIVATVNIGNVASIRALEKNGFLRVRSTENILHLEATYDLDYFLNR